MRISVWDLSRLNEQQIQITREAIEAVDSFDWEWLRPGLEAGVGRDHIPVEWIDLSRFQQAAEEAIQASQQARAHEDEHDHGEPDDTGVLHWHVTDEEGNEGHVLAAVVDGRRQALGLAWYSGKVSIEQTLVNRPDIAREVFLAEGAHMVDFFFMTPEQREGILDVYYGGDPAAQDLSTVGWFEETGNNDYWAWVGESFMSGFIFAFAPQLPQPLEANQPWKHRSSPEIGQQIREILRGAEDGEETPPPTPPTPEEPVEPAGPDVPSDPSGRVFGDKDGEVYHDSHRHPNISQDIWWDSPDEAEAAGRRPCGTCHPERIKEQ